MNCLGLSVLVASVGVLPGGAKGHTLDNANQSPSFFFLIEVTPKNWGYLAEVSFFKLHRVSPSVCGAEKYLRYFLTCS